MNWILSLLFLLIRWDTIWLHILKCKWHICFYYSSTNGIVGFRVTRFAWNLIDLVWFLVTGERLTVVEMQCERLRMLYRDCARPPPPPLQADRRQVSKEAEMNSLSLTHEWATEHRSACGVGAKLVEFLEMFHLIWVHVLERVVLWLQLQQLHVPYLCAFHKRMY